MSSLSASPSAPAFLSKMLTNSPSPRSSRQLSSLTPRKKGSIGDADGVSPNKVERRRSEKEKKPSYDIGTLFHAVEHQELELVKAILETGSVQINSLNSENLTPLDVAVMTNNIPMAKMLLQHGARESPLFERGDCRLDRLEMLVAEAEKKVVDLTAVVLNGSSGNVNISPAQQKETENQLGDWEYRHRLLKRMKAGYDHARPPDPPTNVCLCVTSSSSLLVSFGEPLNHNGSVVTKYKIEWSFVENFMSLAGEATLEDVRQLAYEIKRLHKGEAYFVRMAAWNMKGYSEYMPSNPPYAVPSNWRDIEGVSSRTDGKVQSLQTLFQQVKQCRPADASEIRGWFCDSPLQRKRMSIKNLFISTPKFQKSLKRGVYIACLLYNGDRVLVTSEEQLPIVEVDENFSGTSIQSELYWIMKIASTWDDVKSLRRDMDKSSSAGVVHFRNKLLQAASLLQNSLGIHDLGQFYHKPLKDSNGSIVLVTVNHVHDTKFIALGSSKWVSIGKLARRLSLAGTDTGVASTMLIQSIPEMIVHHQVSSISLPHGLYLGYLKLHCTVENINVLVQQKTPNVLPHVKVRDWSNVSREEWQYILSLNRDEACSVDPPLKEFHAAIGKACRRLLDMLGLPPGSDHRLYDLEVIELSPDISFILVLPPAEDVFIVPGQTEELTDRHNLIFLPVQVFEMIHMSTYQQTFITHYSRLSSILEMDINLAQQAQRQAFSPDEVSIAKDRVDVMIQLQQHLDMLWKSVRWVMDIIAFARDRNMRGGIPISKLISSETSDTPELSRKSKIHDNNNSSSTSAMCNSNEISVGKDNRKIAKFYDPNEETSPSSTGQAVDSDASASSSQPSSGVLRVYAAYDCGLSKGISVKLNVTLRTTARDVINLVVRQLNKAVVTRGKEGPVYSEEELDDFCLVAVIGARERILRDDYQPLQLQNPWTKGRLYVRLRNNLLAAIQQGHATAV
ncbi:ankyrin repeat and fibronectin type-III domain-containing protein 1-like [Gigantopelta aegis]|uniref:ankyrin repeat and fibronectin type-III domain-containing protein 1-like n=1 Tax=Gigantopelta aegis TaxID=1735272 RepID=UPI001B8882A0|nr:ankyrin repeat and fibronectin type-III domain-containing protein 1-like [Gigantopelta aegis]